MLARLAGALALVLVLPLLAQVSVGEEYRQLGTSSVIFLLLLAAFFRFDSLSRVLAGWATRYRVTVLAGGFLLVAALITWLVFENIPHVSDEVAYQFQARAIARGRLWISPPANPEFFDFLHTINDGAKWYGIMNPGWPVMLATGYAAKLPWIINPILGAATLLLLYDFLKRAGYTAVERRLAVLLLAVSPFVLFMSATYMAHSANLFLFVLFLWAWMGMMKTERWQYAAVAGLATAANLLVRPIDTAAVSAPFLVYFLIIAVRRWKLVPHLIVFGALASLGVAATWLYNQQLTGDWRVMPMTKYFVDLNPNEKFGLGFGADMGTKVHGPEWPGYYPIDAIRVTSLRLLELLKNLYGVPLVAAAALFLGVRSRHVRGMENRVHALLIASAVALVGLYIFHFYHGIAYGSRHYYLAAPALAVIFARALAEWLRSEKPTVARSARAALAALLLFTITYSYGQLISEYGNNYRGSSAALRDAVQEQGLSNAVVLVAQDTRTWAWKSAFPLNEYPFERSNVIYAKDLGAENLRLRQQFPDRAFFHARVRGTRVEIRPADLPPGR